MAMIRRLVESALQTGCLSVESEGLIRQMLTLRSYASTDLEALRALQDAVDQGQIKREARTTMTDWLPSPMKVNTLR